jgi:hypothetical protein
MKRSRKQDRASELPYTDSVNNRGRSNINNYNESTISGQGRQTPIES